ncbi:MULTISPECIES: hypothetical protein [Bacillus]|uniref:Uncharacterized protein n=2 Tax=Bacillus TaxID=1386 RepID=A0A0M4FK51_9BACI|nr:MULTISPECIES: hypothetical protein [Bacillus]ALC83649.1 hypothetical protein AM592_20560 [Bacillus gobiensis]MBP1082669.1 ligand-binding sensor domain-containing protein [Bacillus capparidis]MED1097106.1 hypothetical protein [Bacillus capparidis]
MENVLVISDLRPNSSEVRHFSQPLYSKQNHVNIVSVWDFHPDVLFGKQHSHPNMLSFKSLVQKSQTIYLLTTTAAIYPFSMLTSLLENLDKKSLSYKEIQFINVSQQDEQRIHECKQLLSILQELGAPDELSAM